MARYGWNEYRTSGRSGALRYDILEGRFMRLRDRSMDDPEKGSAYVVIDVRTGRVLIEQTLFVPKQGRSN